MKNLILLCLLFSFSFGNIKWGNYKSGILNKEDKPIFYVLSASYCVYCKRNIEMMNNTPVLKKYIEDNFINIYEEKDIDIIPAYLDQDITPTYYVLNKKGEILDKLRGSQDKDSLLKFLNKNLYKFRSGK